LKVCNGLDRSISIEISKECIACGACVEVCPMGALSFELGQSSSRLPIVVDPSICLKCGQCIAICPKDAIFHSHFRISDFPLIGEKAQVQWNQFIARTRQRRSIRNFSSRPVPNEIVMKILEESSRYAPTGHNRQAVEVVLLTGDRLTAVRDEMNALITRLQKILVGIYWISAQMELQWRNMRAFKREIELGMDPSTRKAPLAMLFITDNRAKENETDAAIISYQTLLSAEILGLKTCYFGAIVNALPFSRKLKRILQLPRHRIVVTGLLLGYAQSKFRRLVSREHLKVLN
jgi:ferredoxin